MWKTKLKGFAIQSHPVDWEQKALVLVSCLEQIPYKLYNNPKYVPHDWVPSGTVPWVSDVLGVVIKPNYFPDFLRRDWVKRNVWECDKWPLKRVFVKPSDKHKRFNSFITSGTYSKKKKGPFWCSDIVKFIDEWRYYIAYGKVIGGYWYFGEGDTPKDAPDLNINYPSDWCGTADFGQLEDGSIELVECHHPFACGWYGKNHKEYAEFLTLGWEYLKYNFKS